MKTPILLVTLILFFASCENQQTQKQTVNTNTKNIEGTIFGNEISDDNILSSEVLTEKLQDHKTIEIKLEGKIDAVCQGSGCWLNMDIGNGKTVHVTFKDEAFTLPKNIAGKKAVIDGIATTDIVSIEMQKKMAEKDGKTQAQIDSITKPLTEYYFEAEGVTMLNEE